MITQTPTSLSNPLLLPHSSPFSTVEEQINQKRKREEEEMGCESPQQTNNIPHSSSPNLQFQPTTPEKSTNCFSNPKIVKRMQESTCFKCGQEGHWSWFCTNNNNKHSPVSASKKIHCRCGHGFCDVRISGSERNKNRLYFACPIKMGKPCSTFVKWCDDHIDERDLQPPLITYPECECGAGVCRREMEGAKYYFTCPIKQTHGTCGYRVSEDELLNNASNDEPVNNTSIGNDLGNDMAEGGDLLLTTKRMRITDGSENPSPVAVSKIPEGKSGGSPIEETNSQPVGFPEIEFEDDQELINLASWAAIEAKDSPSSRFSTPSRISCRPSVFPRDNFSADASFGIFPSFDPIDVPKQTSTLNSQSECNKLTIKSPIPNRSPGSEKLKEQKHKEVVIYTQKGLLNDLEGLDFHQHESMRDTAEAAFSVLKCLGFECKQFSDYVREFINLATSMAEIDKSMENSPTLEEHSKFLEEEKVRLANIRDDCVKTETMLAVSDEKINLLSEEVAHLQALLLQKQNELKICKLEKVKVETQLETMKRKMSEVDLTVKDKARQAEAAREKNAERDTKQIAARTALEKAKRALEN